MPADFAGELNDDRFFLTHAAERPLVPDDVDHCRINAYGDGFHFMKRPLVRLVMLASCRDNGQFRECPPDGRLPPDVDA